MQVYAKLLNEGEYLASLSTIYPVLNENKLVKEHHRIEKHQPRAIPDMEATTPGQVCSWDITKLAGPVKSKYFDCYFMVDIYSRFIVGVHAHVTGSSQLAVEMMKEIFGIHGIPQVACGSWDEHDVQDCCGVAIGFGSGQVGITASGQ